MSATPIAVADETLELLRKAQALLATIENPAIQLDPAWEEAVDSVARAERATKALTEYGRLRPERLEG